MDDDDEYNISESKRGTLNGKIIKVNGIEEIEEYEKIESFGKGGFGICYKYKNNQETFIVKELENNKISYYEKDIHNNLKNPNIVQLKKYFYNKKKKKLYLFLECCENKDLYSLLEKRKTLKEVEVQYYITKLIEALKYLHKKGIVHRDIKLSNIFLTDELEVKLGDFGLATELYPREKKFEKCGTQPYMAPEIFEGNGYSFEVDIWAIGIIIYQLILGKLPFYEKNKNSKEGKIKSIKNIKNVIYSFPKDAIISNAAKDLIKQILVKDPKKRPTLNQILQHDFFKLGSSVPELLPVVFKDEEPSINYIKNFMPDADDNGVVNRRFISKNIIDIRIE